MAMSRSLMDLGTLIRMTSKIPSHGSTILLGRSMVPAMLTVSAIVSFILVLATCFNIKIAKYTAAPYALFEGLLLGAVSMMFESQWHGIVLQAVFATFATLFVMLMLYKARIIK